MKCKLMTCVFALTALLSLAPAQEARAQRPYDGIQAGFDAWQLGEERRQAAVAEQLRTSDDLKFWSGLPTSRGEVLEEYLPPAPYVVPGYAEYGYEYGARGPLRRTQVRERVWVAPPAVGPLPYGPRYTVGSAPPLVRQPVGRVEMQTGPNRWESHPVYDPPLPNYRPSPPVASPWLDGTPYDARRPAPLIAPPIPQSVEERLPEPLYGVPWQQERPTEEPRFDQRQLDDHWEQLPPDDYVPPPPPRSRER
jgi:hypothetical protein